MPYSLWIIGLFTVGIVRLASHGPSKFIVQIIESSAEKYKALTHKVPEAGDSALG
jgi:hypothetical protein